jgi:hypothetical protein
VKPLPFHCLMRRFFVYAYFSLFTLAATSCLQMLSLEGARELCSEALTRPRLRCSLRASGAEEEGLCYSMRTSGWIADGVHPPAALLLRQDEWSQAEFSCNALHIGRHALPPWQEEAENWVSCIRSAI